MGPFPWKCPVATATIWALWPNNLIHEMYHLWKLYSCNGVFCDMLFKVTLTHTQNHYESIEKPVMSSLYTSMIASTCAGTQVRSGQGSAATWLNWRYCTNIQTLTHESAAYYSSRNGRHLFCFELLKCFTMLGWDSQLLWSSQLLLLMGHMDTRNNTQHTHTHTNHTHRHTHTHKRAHTQHTYKRQR